MIFQLKDRFSAITAIVIKTNFHPDGLERIRNQQCIKTQMYCKTSNKDLEVTVSVKNAEHSYPQEYVYHQLYLYDSQILYL